MSNPQADNTGLQLSLIAFGGLLLFLCAAWAVRGAKQT
jgi:hypothetical protein